MRKVVFKLSMPNKGSWNGKWSGSGRNYIITKNLTDERLSFLGLDKKEQSWFYFFGDGWTACINARILDKGERLKKSNGFYGYEWMVSNIICDNEI